MSGGEMSEGKKRKKQKLKLRMSASPNETSQGSRAVSPDVKANAAAGGKAASPRESLLARPPTISSQTHAM